MEPPPLSFLGAVASRDVGAIEGHMARSRSSSSRRQGRGQRTPTACLLMVLIFLSSSPSSALARANYVHLNLLESETVQTPDSIASLQEVVRPSPSDELPLEDLLENPDPSLDPSPKDLNRRALRRRLGRRLDREFLSVDQPAGGLGSRQSLLQHFKRGRPDEPRPDFLRYLRTFRLADGSRVKLKSGRKQRRRLQKLVWSFTHCPVLFTWKDLGVRFWPRWLKEGRCWNGRSCSFPPGMTCQPSSSVTTTLLRWHCRSKGPRLLCRWIPVKYPIITQCSCAC